jgi:hypothetical protein
MDLPSFVFQAIRVAAVRGLEKPAKGSTPADPKVSHVQPPYQNIGAEKARHYVMCCDPAGFPDPVADSSATPKAYPPHFRQTTDATCRKHPRNPQSVGAAVGCDLLIFKRQDQKIAACGSSYGAWGV